MSSPFAIDGPAVISFSGGRTSAYMLRRVLDEGLRPDVHVLFANTGKEREETLSFVEEVALRWQVNIRWLERGYDGSPVEVFPVTASRQGEPFIRIVSQRGYTPGPVSRFCSTELKTLLFDKWMRAQGYPLDWFNVVGIRADEPRRVAKMRGGNHKRGWEIVLPLADAGITEAQVMEFWHWNAFDLRLRSDQGNCDLCFLKSRKKLVNLIRDEPTRAAWWATIEAEFGAFRRDRPGYQAMLNQPDMFAATITDDLTDCFCTD